jgi:hypothetical protein
MIAVAEQHKSDRIATHRAHFVELLVLSRETENRRYAWEEIPEGEAGKTAALNSVGEAVAAMDLKYDAVIPVTGSDDLRARHRKLFEKADVYMRMLLRELTVLRNNFRRDQNWLPQYEERQSKRDAEVDPAQVKAFEDRMQDFTEMIAFKEADLERASVAGFLSDSEFEFLVLLPAEVETISGVGSAPPVSGASPPLVPPVTTPLPGAAAPVSGVPGRKARVQHNIRQFNNRGPHGPGIGDGEESADDDEVESDDDGAMDVDEADLEEDARAERRRNNIAANKSAEDAVLDRVQKSSSTMFGGAAIGNGYDFVPEYAELVVPDVRYPASRFLDRISVEKVLHNMIVPVLAFSGDGSVVSFPLLHPTAVAVYAVIADGSDSVTNMMLIYRDPAFSTRIYPQCISFEHGLYSKPVSILVYSELALRTRVLERGIQDALLSYGILYPIAPSTTSTGSSGSFQLTTGGIVEKSDGKNLAEWLPIRRALHGDKAKILAFTLGDMDMKISNPRFLTRIRNNSQLADNILDLPIMQSALLLKFLTMNFCLVIDWIGTGATKVPDGCHLCMFMPGTLGSYPYFKFQTSEDIIAAIDHLKAVSMDSFGERYQSTLTPCFRHIFEPIKDQFRDRNPATRIYHLPIDYQVHHTQALFVQFASLFTNRTYEHMDVSEFRDLCVKTLTIDTTKWRRDKGEDDSSCIPRQIIAPPGLKIEVPKGGVKFTRAEKREFQKSKSPGQKERVKPAGVKKAADPPVVVAPAVVPNAANSKKGLCLKDLLHRKDPVEFSTPCPRLAAQCKFRHGVHLTAAGKLNPVDKAAVLAGISTMDGPFAVQARTYIEAHL